MVHKKPKVTIIPSGSKQDDPFNQVATYYLFEDDETLPTKLSPELRKVLNLPTTPQWMRELFERVLVKNKLRMRWRELRAKLTPEERAELKDIEQILKDCM